MGRACIGQVIGGKEIEMLRRGCKQAKALGADWRRFPWQSTFNASLSLILWVLSPFSVGPPSSPLHASRDAMQAVPPIDPRWDLNLAQ